MSDKKLTELVKDIKDNAVQAGVTLKPAAQKVIDASKVFTQKREKTAQTPLKHSQRRFLHN